MNGWIKCNLAGMEIMATLKHTENKKKKKKNKKKKKKKTKKGDLSRLYN